MVPPVIGGLLDIRYFLKVARADLFHLACLNCLIVGPVGCLHMCMYRYVNELNVYFICGRISV